MIRIFKKDLVLFLKDKQGAILSFVLPIVLISLFSLAFGGIRGNSSSSITLLIHDADSTSTSSSIVNALDAMEGLNLIRSTAENANEEIKKGNDAAALILHSGVEQAKSNGEPLPLELIYDEARQMEVGIIQSILSTQIAWAIMPDNIEPAPSLFHMQMTSVVGEEKTTNAGLIQAVAGTAILMLLFNVAGLGVSILEEKESGTLNRILSSPLNPRTILMGKMASTFFLAIIQLTVMFVFSWLVFGLDITANLPALIIMIVATAFAVSSFGIFLAAISKTRQQARGLSTLIILIMSATGGSMIPIFMMPEIMKKIAVVSVNYWGIQGFFDIFWRNLSLLEIMPKILILLGIGLLISIISMRLFSKNVMKLA